MLKFNTRIVGVVAVLAVIAPASVADAKTRQYTATLTSSTLSTANGYPGLGGTAYLSGALESKPFGAGALIDRVVMTGQPWGGPVLTFEGTEVAVFADGTQRSRFTGHSLTREDGTTDVVVNGRITGGTERFRGARGRYTFEGTIPEGSTELAGSSRGRIRF